MQKKVWALVGALGIWALWAPQVQATGQGPKTGESLYQNYCADCHSPLERTRIPARRPDRIASAIRYVPAMYHLQSLSREQVEAIASTLPPKPNP